MSRTLKHMRRPPYDNLYKLILVGNSKFGKSCFLLQLTDKRFNPEYDMTIGVEFGTRTLQVADKKIKLQIWDTAGEEDFRPITRSYFRGANAALIFLDPSFKKGKNEGCLDSFYYEVKRHSHDAEIYVVINKTDLLNTDQQKCSLEELKSLAQTKVKADHIFSCSAHNDSNIESTMQEVARQLRAALPDVGTYAEMTQPRGASYNPPPPPLTPTEKLQNLVTDYNKSIDWLNIKKSKSSIQLAQDLDVILKANNNNPWDDAGTDPLLNCCKIMSTYIAWQYNMQIVYDRKPKALYSKLLPIYTQVVKELLQDAQLNRLKTNDLPLFVPVAAGHTLGEFINDVLSVERRIDLQEVTNPQQFPNANKLAMILSRCFFSNSLELEGKDQVKARQKVNAIQQISTPHSQERFQANTTGLEMRYQAYRIYKSLLTRFKPLENDLTALKSKVEEIQAQVTVTQRRTTSIFSTAKSTVAKELEDFIIEITAKTKQHGFTG